MQRPERFSEYAANAVDEREYAQVATLLVKRLAPTIPGDTAVRIIQNVITETFLPPYTSLDEDLKDLPEWPWPEIEQLDTTYPDAGVLLDRYAQQEAINTDTDWLLEKANQDRDSWLATNSMVILREWQRRLKLPKARTKEELVALFRGVDDPEIDRLWQESIADYRQQVDEVERNRLNPSCEHYAQRLGWLIFNHLDAYHTATNSTSKPEVMASINLMHAKQEVIERRKNAEMFDKEAFRRSLIDHFNAALGKYWWLSFKARLMFQGFMRNAINYNRIRPEQEYINEYISGSLIPEKSILTIRDQCDICKTTGKATEFDYSDPVCLPPYHQACRCRHLTWERQYLTRDSVPKTSVEKAVQAVFAGKFHGLSVSMPSLREMLPIYQAVIADMPMMKVFSAWLRSWICVL
jgi:hypothetical protein